MLPAAATTADSNLRFGQVINCRCHPFFRMQMQRVYLESLSFIFESVRNPSRPAKPEPPPPHPPKIKNSMSYIPAHLFGIFMSLFPIYLHIFERSFRRVRFLCPLITAISCQTSFAAESSEVTLTFPNSSLCAEEKWKRHKKNAFSHRMGNFRVNTNICSTFPSHYM